MLPRLSGKSIAMTFQFVTICNHGFISSDSNFRGLKNCLAVCSMITQTIIGRILTLNWNDDGINHVDHALLAPISAVVTVASSIRTLPLSTSMDTSEPFISLLLRPGYRNDDVSVSVGKYRWRREPQNQPFSPQPPLALQKLEQTEQMPPYLGKNQ